jgi:hypothetical protein
MEVFDREIFDREGFDGEGFDGEGFDIADHGSVRGRSVQVSASMKNHQPL